MHEAYQPLMDDGRGRFPEDLRVKAPRGVRAAIAVTAELKNTSHSGYVRQALLRCLEADGVKLRRGSDAHEAAIHAQIREKLAGMKDMKERMMFLEQHGADPALASAVLSAPAFLSDLTDVELALVRSKLEQSALPPGVVEAKVAVAKALREVEVGWERARAKIAFRGGLEKSPSGPVSAAA